MKVERSAGYAPGFDLSIVDGDSAESEFTRILAAFGDTIEVKNDLKCRQTGNVAIEFAQHGQPSGIAVTTAEWWAHRVHDEVWIVMPVARLKRIARPFFSRGKTKEMGDNGNVGVLIPCCDLLGEVPVEPPLLRKVKTSPSFFDPIDPSDEPEF